MTENLRMYIIVRDSVPFGLAMVAVGHAALAAYLKFQNEPIMQEWLKTSFRKVVCKVTDEEFLAAKQIEPQHVVFVEPDWYNEEVAMAFCPKVQWSTRFKYLRLYK